ncbi:ribosome maturation factor RimP [Orenia marismortui]|uniref:Ribosome maturation factor RimP n=1 Tax=Orenia marismortui TaxID=46469 RepID=A0A4R8H909_9FIRM|nr:ribosome maturation factor RimP [Orenia marismortui]TDX51884.1 ribosome maturation factor RimP [Orenia marismortui]
MAKKAETLVEELAKPIIEEKGLELVDVEYKKEGENWVLRIFIDQEDGVSLENCQEISRMLSEQLDIDDPIANSYLLEVSSPGIDRPLKTEKDYKRFSGRLIDISTYAPINGQRKLTGELLGLKDDNIEIRIDGDEILVPLDKVSQTRLAIEF